MMLFNIGLSAMLCLIYIFIIENVSFQIFKKKIVESNQVISKFEITPTGPDESHKYQIQKRNTKSNNWKTINHRVNTR